MNEIRESTLIADAQNFVSAPNPSKFYDAKTMVQIISQVGTVEYNRAFSKHLKLVNEEALMDRVREKVLNGDCSEAVSAALEDRETLPEPVLAAIIVSRKSRQLAREVEGLSSVGNYVIYREKLLKEMENLSTEEREAVSGLLAQKLTDLLILEVLDGHAEGDPVLARQLRLWQMFRTANETGQAQLAPYFLVGDGAENVRSLLPCCIPVHGPAVDFYGCAAILRVLAYQKEAWECDTLVHALHDRVEQEMMYRISRNRNDADTSVLAELFALLHTIVETKSLAVWDSPCFEELKKKLEDM